MNTRHLVTSASVVMLALAGCSDPGDTPSETPVAPSSISSSSAATSPSSSTGSTTPNDPVTPSATASPSFTTGPLASAPATPADTFLITGLRVGSHPLYDRVVIDLSGGRAEDLPWSVQYRDSPTAQGSGEPIGLDAEAYVRVQLSGQMIPPQGTDVPSGLQPDSAVGNVRGVYADPVFEGQSIVWIGVDRVRGYAVMTLESPARLVVDIAT
ncbi:AMIN-like domain-containing (lipo)protein [Brooklawnia cerclae]|uniref:AMIN-like domain-containing protein n=1 Tax=Brooklawnia cerclae TaxID=349934 RepID=A0ABX0SHA2_9ACTN|nr:hypothetical protein [Brooklawnia cerclae]NIH56092.1 hypothetical protein [Brooklawnia cerclae]